MFDKLIESNSAGAEFKPRRTFFMVSFVVVGIVFLSALVFDLYAANIDLGTDNFELVEIFTPVDTEVPKPEPVRPQSPQRNDQQDRTELPSRKELINRIETTPPSAPEISTTPNTRATIPVGRFNFDPNGIDRNGSGPAGPPAGTNEVGSSSAGEPRAAETAEVVREPPPVVVKAEPKKTILKTEGVINGKATYLPNPPYPLPAKMVGAFGVVNVQVVIDENGKVISSKAVSGHPLLRPTAESAAWKAKFSTTYLSRVPVKVTGVIVFNFKR